MPLIDNFDFEEYKPPKETFGNKPNGLVYITGDEYRGQQECCEPFLVLANLDSTDRKYNDVDCAFEFGDSVSFVLKKDGEVTTYTPTSSEFVNELNCFHTTIEWRDVLASDGVGCYVLEVTSTLAGIVRPTTIWAEYTLMPFYSGNYNNALGTVRVLSNLNDQNDTYGINMTGANLLTSLRFDGKFGYFNDNTEVDNVEYVNGKMQKVKREYFTSYELRVNLNGYNVIERLRMHVLAENSCWISDHNFDNYSFQYFDIPVIVQEGFVPEHFDGARKIMGVVKFEDKVRRKRTHFNDNRQTAEALAPSDVPSCLPASYLVQYVDLTLIQSGTIASGGSVTVNVPNPVGGSPRKTAKLMQTGQPVSFITGDAADVVFGRATDFLTLDAAPLHDDGSPTINTTTFRFTDEFGGQTFTTGIILDWSNWDGSQLLGWQNNFRLGSPLYGASGYAPLTYAITFCNSFSLGGFSGWHQCNFIELSSITQDKLNGFNYFPFNNSFVNFLWTNSTISVTTARRYRQDNASWEIAVIASNGANPFPCRYFSLSLLNVLS